MRRSLSAVLAMVAMGCGPTVLLESGGDGDGGSSPGSGGSSQGGGASFDSPFLCTHVSLMVTDQPGYENWIGAWFGVTKNAAGTRYGSLLPYDEPNTPEVEEQFYYDERTSAVPEVLAIGPSNSGAVPEQIITVTTDAGTLAVYLPSFTPDDCVRTRFYVAADGSSYHSRADHDYSYDPEKANLFGSELCFGEGAVGPDLTPAEAFTAEHLARAAPR